MPNHRIERVSQEIQREVNDILQKRVKDPRVQGITITDVAMTGDLSEATVYYSSLAEKASEREKIQTGLDKAAGLVRSEIGKRIKLYKTPEIKFKLDESIEYGNRIDQLLAQLHQNEEKPMED